MSHRSAEGRREEWLLMYRAGLTTARIAEICHTDPRSVRSSISHLKKLTPLLEETHRKNRPVAEPTGPRFLRWTQRCEEAEHFVAINGRLPLSNAPDPMERSLANWFTAQRKKRARGTIGEARSDLLNRIPGWDTPEQRHRDEAHWSLRLDQLAKFCAQHHRLPSVHSPLTEHERVLSVWVHSQRVLRTKNQLSAKRYTLLDEAVPEWRKDQRRRGARRLTMQA